MPEFQLNVPPSARELAQARRYNPSLRKRVHSFYNLDDFARGYVEAMFFTNGDIGDEDRPDLLNELGVDRLTRAAVADIAADCAKFQSANRADLDAAKALEPGADDFRYARDDLDDRRLGHLFWYARQGHGVAFTDDGDAEFLARLQDAARRFGEAYCEVYRGWIGHR